MERLDKEKVYNDISDFIYKYTHDSALTYPLPEDYVELSKDMHFAKNILRITFPEGEHVRGGQTIERVIYDSGRPMGNERAYNYKVSLGGDIEVVMRKRRKCISGYAIRFSWYTASSRL